MWLIMTCPSADDNAFQHSDMRTGNSALGVQVTHRGGNSGMLCLSTGLLFARLGSTSLSGRQDMNLILVAPSDIVTSHATPSSLSNAQPLDVRITDQRRLRHLHEVHRASVGDGFNMGVLNGDMGRGTLTALNSTEARFELTLDTPPPPALPLHLILALPRPRMLARTLENITALGVKQVTLLNTRRVEKSYWQSPELAREKIDQHLWLGLEQTRDTRWPDIQLEPLFKPFVEDRLPALLEGKQGLIAHPHTERECPRGLPLSQPTVLAIGPEGGFIPYEVEQLTAAGLAPVHIGPRILRVETAVVALLSRLY